MEVKACRVCGKLFSDYGVSNIICAKCYEDEEKKFELAKKYIEDNPATNMKEVSEELGISIRLIQKWIHEERLVFSDKRGFLRCDKCGVEIALGRFCTKCKKEMLNNINSYDDNEKKNHMIGKDSKESESVKRNINKMRFLQ